MTKTTKMGYFKKVKIGLIIAGLILIASCTNSSNIETQIRTQIEKQCSGDSCTINLNQVVHFDWDKMVAFSTAAPPDVVNNAIGIEYPYFVEFTAPFIFLKNNKIVHYENNVSDDEGPVDGLILFNHADSIKYAICFKQNPVFKVKKNHFGKELAYLLSQ